MMLYVFGQGEVPISICGDPKSPVCVSFGAGSRAREQRHM